jgi:hypothetical protein
VRPLNSIVSWHEKRTVDHRRAIVALSDSVVPRSWYGGFSTMNQPQQFFVAIWGLEADVNNGGFSQYFFNSYGDYSQIAEKALREIGANLTADILRSAMAVFPFGVPPTDRTRRQLALEQIDEAMDWTPLNRAFYAYPEDLAKLLLEYVERNREAFGFRAS